MKHSFFQAAVVSILLYGCTTWTLTKRLEKKLDRQLHKNVESNIEQVLATTPHETPTVRPPASHHENYTGQTKPDMLDHCWRSKNELVSDVLLWTPTYGQAKAGRPARTYIQQLCEDTGCNLEDLPEAMNDREKWREMVKDIRACGTRWWWSGHSLGGGVLLLCRDAISVFYSPSWLGKDFLVMVIQFIIYNSSI